MRLIKINIILLLVLLLELGCSQDQAHKNFEEDVVRYAELLRLPTLVVGVAKADSLIYFKGINNALNHAGDTITPDHMFPIASITKSLTAVIMQQMEDEEKISLGDPVGNYPNRYFDENRWGKNTTLAHILSHTSESVPIGKNFIYNGGKYNLVFNVFNQINENITDGSVTRPFTIEIENRLLDPLNMDHSLVDYREPEHSHLEQYKVGLYAFNKSQNQYVKVSNDWKDMQCGPGYGMISSLSDLIRYSNSLNDTEILKADSYKRITTPYYPESPYALGWFTFNVEGHEMHWGYGYGDYDSAILVRVPSKNMTLVLLSSCSIPSESTRLGYGNPLNSPIVASFVQNYLLNEPGIDISRDGFVETVDRIKPNEISSISIEEAFAVITSTILSPTTNNQQKEEASELLKLLVHQFPNERLWESTTAFELFAQLKDEQLMHHSWLRINKFKSPEMLHPAKLYYAGVISEQLGNQHQAIELYKTLADGPGYKEQIYKHHALMKLAKYYLKSHPERSQAYLQALVKYKRFISVQDAQLDEAQSLLSSF